MTAPVLRWGHDDLSAYLSNVCYFTHVLLGNNVKYIHEAEKL